MRYVLVDRITELEPGRSIRALKNVTVSEDLVRPLTRGFSTLPASMVLEAIAQAAGILAGASTGCSKQPVLAKVQPFQVHGHARPGDRIELTAELLDLRDQGCHAKGRAEVEGRLIAEGDIFLALIALETGGTSRDEHQIYQHLADLFPEWFAPKAAEVIE